MKSTLQLFKAFLRSRDYGRIYKTVREHRKLYEQHIRRRG